MRLCIIPARGGSKRIPGKNTIDFMGHPLIARSIIAARASGVFDEVMVSTDSERIAEVARRYGASVPFMRSEATATDFATTADVIEEVISRYSDAGKRVDSICCLYATAPFVMPYRLRQGANLLEKGYAGAFTVMRFSYPPQRGLKINEAGCVEMLHPEFASARSQDLMPVYHDAGQFYFCNVEAFLMHRTLWVPGTAPILLAEEEGQDIDTPSDLKIALQKAQMLSFPDEFESAGFLFRNYTTLSGEENETVLCGRNDPDVRKEMINEEIISPENHARFITTLSGRLDKAYYACYKEGKFIGTVNIELTAPQEAERGVWMAAEARGKGMAAPLMKAFYTYLYHNKGIQKIITRVKISNAASNALERKLGATLMREADGYNFYEVMP